LYLERVSINKAFTITAFILSNCYYVKKQTDDEAGYLKFSTCFALVNTGIEEWVNDCFSSYLY